MHLSHLDEQLDTWYQLFDFDERVDTVFRPGLRRATTARRRCRQAPGRRRDSRADRAAASDAIGRSATAPRSRRPRACRRITSRRTGPSTAKGTAIPHRADFNTLDNPFFWSADPTRDGMSDQPSAGVHFVVFNPTSDDFERVRNAMDGVFPGRRAARPSRRATAARASTRCSRRRTGRTSSCRRGGTARSRSRSLRA